ncbi:hypothetical protein SISSUDRAFT_1038314 [Sistotremastrum suecicum HHB10207 ss-3]|uniref:Uncharacterized protein n=1 Tax=Sistotremastrum suecicum HHB10207 ss-3 TaxID=1314776 RepID=A0A165WXF2_9AGAM|nr:hypothetical protein SISSUDRAFT_1038314 [Sistotremastrum suecicum HHB10207 ss-3]
MPHDPRDNFVRLAGPHCSVAPGSLIDFHPRREIIGAQAKLLKLINSICLRNESSVKLELESLLFEGDPVAKQAHGEATHTWLFLSKAITDPSLISPKPITLLLWDKPSPQELKLAPFRKCSDVLRISSSLPPVHCYSPSAWIANVSIQALFDLRSYDPHVRVSNIAFACTTVQVCVCMAIRGGDILAEHRQALVTLTERGDQSSIMAWKKEGDILYRTDRKHMEKVTSDHIAECVAATQYPFRLLSLSIRSHDNSKKRQRVSLREKILSRRKLSKSRGKKKL